MNAITRAKRARRLLYAGRIGPARATCYVLLAMPPEFVFDFPQAARMLAISLLHDHI